MEIMVFGDAAEWESWLAEHCASQSGAWLKIAKKGSGRVSVTASEALDLALCYGWIDGQRRSHDESYFLQRYSRRRPASLWSKVNVDKVEALIAAGRMRPPGLAEITAAKADGRWDAAYESQRNATVPPDLAAALEDNERAGRYFASLAKTDRYLVILGLITAKTPATRAARLRRTIATLEAGRKVR
jgi:uncharacterized protein YdeI (YjbR/CyaY-like superfamily)